PPAPSRPFPQPGPSQRLPSCELSPRFSNISVHHVRGRAGWGPPLIYASAATVAATSETATARPTVLGHFMGVSFAARLRITASHVPIPRAIFRSASPSNRCIARAPAARPAWCSWLQRGCEVAHDADLHVMGLQVLNRDWFRGLLKEGGAIDQRFV